MLGWPIAQRERLKGRFSLASVVIGVSPIRLIVVHARACHEIPMLASGRRGSSTVAARARCGITNAARSRGLRCEALLRGLAHRRPPMPTAGRIAGQLDLQVFGHELRAGGDHESPASALRRHCTPSAVKSRDLDRARVHRVAVAVDGPDDLLAVLLRQRAERDGHQLLPLLATEASMLAVMPSSTRGSSGRLTRTAKVRDC